MKTANSSDENSDLYRYRQWASSDHLSSHRPPTPNDCNPFKAGHRSFRAASRRSRGTTASTRLAGDQQIPARLMQFPRVAIDRRGARVGMSDLVLHEALWVIEFGEVCDVGMAQRCRSSSCGNPAASRAVVNASLAARFDKRPQRSVTHNARCRPGRKHGRTSSRYDASTSTTQSISGTVSTIRRFGELPRDAFPNRTNTPRKRPQDGNFRFDLRSTRSRPTISCRRNPYA